MFQRSLLRVTDVEPLVEPLEAALLMAEHASRPGRAFAWNVRCIDYLVEMGDILGKASADVRELLAAYRKPEVDPGKLARMRQVVARARRELA